MFMVDSGYVPSLVLCLDRTFCFSKVYRDSYFLENFGVDVDFLFNIINNSNMNNYAISISRALINYSLTSGYRAGTVSYS